MSPDRDYQGKRDFEESPEPMAQVRGDVDPHTAVVGETFVIHQHHASRLHFDLRLEMLNGRTPVLVSWAVPKNLPLEKGARHLAVHVEDHPFEYGRFSGSIPTGNYGAGEVRIFDSGRLDVLERDGKKITFRLQGQRLQGVFHLIQTSKADDKWLVLMGVDERPPPEPIPPLLPMSPVDGASIPGKSGWTFEPDWAGSRTMVVTRSSTEFFGIDFDPSPALGKLHNQLVATDAVVDGVIVGQGLIAVDLLYLDGRSVTEVPLEERKKILEGIVVPSEVIQVGLVEPDPDVLIKVLQPQGLGVIAKALRSSYEPGIKSDSWVRVAGTT